MLRKKKIDLSKCIEADKTDEKYSKHAKTHAKQSTNNVASAKPKTKTLDFNDFLKQEGVTNPQANQQRNRGGPYPGNKKIPGGRFQFPSLGEEPQPRREQSDSHDWNNNNGNNNNGNNNNGNNNNGSNNNSKPSNYQGQRPNRPPRQQGQGVQQGQGSQQPQGQGQRQQGQGQGQRQQGQGQGNRQQGQGQQGQGQRQQGQGQGGQFRGNNQGQGQRSQGTA